VTACSNWSRAACGSWPDGIWSSSLPGRCYPALGDLRTATNRNPQFRTNVVTHTEATPISLKQPSPSMCSGPHPAQSHPGFVFRSTNGANRFSSTLRLSPDRRSCGKWENSTLFELRTRSFSIRQHHLFFTITRARLARQSSPCTPGRYEDGFVAMNTCRDPRIIGQHEPSGCQGRTGRKPGPGLPHRPLPRIGLTLSAFLPSAGRSAAGPFLHPATTGHRTPQSLLTGPGLQAGSCWDTISMAFEGACSLAKM
jgi:hypothetical protein